MDDRFNTAAGWALFAGIVALGGTILSGEYFKHEKVEKGGFAVADASPEAGAGGAAAAKPTDFSAGDPVKGAEIFKKCASCHTITSGGPAGADLHHGGPHHRHAVAGSQLTGNSLMPWMKAETSRRGSALTVMPGS